MHILSCSEIPVYSFFGPTNWRRNHAIGQQLNILSAKIGEKFQPTSLDKITVGQVIDRLRADMFI
jgi:hypothetical protein